MTNKGNGSINETNTMEDMYLKNFEEKPKEAIV